MPKQIPITKAREQLTSLIRDVEENSAIELTRRGKPVAMLMSIREYERLVAHSPNFWEAYTTFREQVDLENLDIDPNEVFGDLREPSSGREVDW